MPELGIYTCQVAPPVSIDQKDVKKLKQVTGCNIHQGEKKEVEVDIRDLAADSYIKPIIIDPVLREAYDLKPAEGTQHRVR